MDSTPTTAKEPIIIIQRKAANLNIIRKAVFLVYVST